MLFLCFIFSPCSATAAAALGYYEQYRKRRVPTWLWWQYGKTKSVWPGSTKNVDTFRHFEGLFSKFIWQNFQFTFYIFWGKFSLLKLPKYLKTHQAIWSHWTASARWNSPSFGNTFRLGKELFFIFGPK